jgi:Putative MetA-pathway of phenol degradation
MAKGLLAALILLMPALAAAQTMDPRAYANLPVGLNFLLAGYTYSEGELGFDAASPLQDGRTEVHAVPVGYVRSLDVFGKSGSIAVVLPLVDLTATASLNGTTEARRDVSGLGDPLLRLAVNFYGAPARRLPEFLAWRQDLIVGASVTVSAPLGQYDEDRLANIGANRWSVKPELGVSQALGPWTVELAAGVTWFTANDKFFNGNRREQDPLYSTQLHVTRSFGGAWAAFSAIYFDGGRTSLNGVEQGEKLGGTRLGLTVSLPVDRRNAVRLSAHGGLAARTGSDFKGVAAIWQHVWGGT